LSAYDEIIFYIYNSSTYRIVFLMSRGSSQLICAHF